MVRRVTLPIYQRSVRETSETSDTSNSPRELTFLISSSWPSHLLRRYLPTRDLPFFNPILLHSLRFPPIPTLPFDPPLPLGFGVCFHSQMIPARRLLVPDMPFGFSDSNTISQAAAGDAPCAFLLRKRLQQLRDDTRP
jgi:hypothetical protein